jgi:hypothetical protein
MKSTQRYNRKTLPAGWMGHRDIPRPAVVRREPRRAQADWLDCLLTIWIAQATLDSEPGERSQQEAA